MIDAAAGHNAAGGMSVGTDEISAAAGDRVPGALTPPPTSVEAALDLVRRAMEDLEATVRGRATWLRLSSAARELEARARNLANLLEDHTVPLPPRYDLMPLSGTTQISGRFRVLVVDDDPDSVALLDRILSPWFDVRACRDAREAAKVLREEPADVVVADLYMPHGGGMALLELTRALDEGLRTPLVVVSGRADTETRVAAFESGAFDVIAKPVAPSELVARVRNALAHSQQLRRERLLGGRDDLTGLANRRGFRAFLEHALRAAAADQSGLVVVLADQDGLKRINDTWGHHAGDESLRTLARALAASIRGSDCAARVGGDEFALVVPGCDRDGADRLLRRIEEHLDRSPITVEGNVTFCVRASFGVAAFGETSRSETAEQLLRRADAELYAHKRARSAIRRA